ncbi:MAG: bifunctional [glutamate--ammonia ligase]-adenylyl-L-tyrosine phosphorylase/[glutamate--ammonia-ligase] adenylyltransferase [Woeseiaceae bacterium]
MNNALQSIPAELQTPVLRWLDRLPAGLDELPGKKTKDTLVRVVACSEFAGNMLLKYWDHLANDLESLKETIDAQHLESIVDSIPGTGASVDDVKKALREVRNRTLLRLLWREIAGLATLDETMHGLSDLADALLCRAGACAEQQMAERFGRVRDVDGNVVPLVVLGMGKLGGRELNFSSDIDLIFAYSQSGESDGPKTLSAQEYFDRLSRQVVRLMDDVTADGFVFRTDTRLRPFGESGPPVVSFPALESYLLQHGRGWERYAYVKARLISACPMPETQRELFDELITPFVYRRYLDFGVFESLREMHEMIAVEVGRREVADNIKVGPGGIREIEFIVQSLQLVRGGDRPELRDRSLRTVLPLLVDARSIDAAAAEALDSAYVFLRRLENFLQAIRDKQTHELPADGTDRARLSFAMGFADWGQLITQLDEHRATVTRYFDEIAFRGTAGRADQSLLDRLEALWESSASRSEWQSILREHQMSHADLIAARLVAFRAASSMRKVDATAAERLQKFIPRLLSLAKSRQQPAVAVSRCLSVIEKVLRRSAYLALLIENNLAAERFVGLCERSAYIAAEIARFPVLLDELLDPRPLTSAISREELQTELDERLSRSSASDSESRTEVLAQFQRATMFRVAVADFNGSLPLMKVSDSLTWLAETVLQAALDTAWNDLVARHGAPHYDVDGDRRAAGFGIVAYGKLGGLELSYGSDLDIVFLHDSTGKTQVTDGDKPLDNALFFSRLVRRLVHILTTHTNSGVLYEIDTRLRPSGRKGLLVTSTDAFGRYQEENAWTWEHQALLRARAIVGSGSIAAEFGRIRTETLRSRIREDSLKNDVLDMRRRMRDELDRSDEHIFDIKQGRGGVGDVEFIVQYLVLKNAAKHGSVIEYSDNIRQLDALAECGAIETSLAVQLQEIYRQYRLRQHHLVLNDEAPLVPAEEFVSQRERVKETWESVFGA